LTKYEKQKVQGPVDPAEAAADGSPADGEPKTTSLVPVPAPVLAPAPAPSAAPALLSTPMQCSSPVTRPPYCSSGMQVTPLLGESGHPLNSALPYSYHRIP
jgi:hypothetical protein